MTIKDHDTAAADKPTPPPRKFWAGKSALIMPAMLVALALVLIYGIFDMEIAGDAELFGPQAFPWITAGFCLLIAALLTLVILRNPEVPQPVLDEHGRQIASLFSNWRSTGITVGSFLAFTVLLIPAGWIIAGAIVFWGVTVGLGSTRYVVNLLIGLAISSVMQLIFAGMLGLSLPPGVMGMF